MKNKCLQKLNNSLDKWLQQYKLKLYQFVMNLKSVLLQINMAYFVMDYTGSNEMSN